MKITPRAFQFIVALDLALICVGILVIAFLGETGLPEPLRAYEQSRADADLTTRDWVFFGLGALLLITFGVSSIGLLVFWPPARFLFLMTFIAGTAIVPIGGPYISTGVSSIFEDATTFLAGLILGLAYFSPISAGFERRTAATATAA